MSRMNGKKTHNTISNILVELHTIYIGSIYIYIFIFLISLIADGPHHYHPACGHYIRIFPSLPGSRLTIFIEMVGFYLLTFLRFSLRKKEHKSYFGKNRTHDFRTSRCAGYLLEDHSGDYICVCVCFLPIHSGHQVRWTYQPGSHRRKVTQDF